ncbi:MAG TPA: long-chain-fatty-acid--CoA ligase [Terriglobales bacterium]|jgi:fatty-acyl-CoA synthase|nr:long-chain-fatty-acid--CoA ligase [Terriglobales bacterium]
MNIPLTPVRFLRYAQEQFPRKTAVVCQHLRFTYAEFADRVARLAGALRATGAKPGDRIAFLSLNCHRLLEAYFGVLEAGCVLLPLNIRLAAPELAYILNDSGASFLFFEQEFAGLVDSFRRDLHTVRSFHQLDVQSTESQSANQMPQEDRLSNPTYEQMLASATPYRADVMSFDENAVAEIFYTSGTSASPKGVMLTHRNIYLHAMSIALYHHTRYEDVMLHTIPLFHANGWGAAHTITFVGGTHVMLPRFLPEEVFRLVQTERVRALTLVPIMAAALVNSPARPKYDLSSVEWATIGGAASSTTLIREVEQTLGFSCYSGYGLTECSPSLSNAELRPDIQCTLEERYKLQAMTGYAFPGCELRVVDANDGDVPRDGQTMGEIIARSDGVMAGYWQQPEATAEAMRGGWFHTGDMAVIEQNGYIRIVDRKKDIIVSGGENISSLDVEKTLLAHPAVYEAAVIPAADQKWGEVPRAVVVLKPGSEVSDVELIEFCRARLAHYKCPQLIEFCEVLPKTATGKVLKRELRKKYQTEIAQ